MPITNDTRTGKTTTHAKTKANAAHKTSATTKAESKPKTSAKPKTDATTKQKLGALPDQQPASSGARVASTVAVRAGTTPKTSTKIIHEITTRKQFDSLFAQGASVTAGAPTELKFLIDRKTHQTYFIPPAYPFHFNFYRDVLKGTMSNEEFDQHAYNRPDRDFIAGTVTAYDSYVDAKTGKKGQVCFSLWPTDTFDPKLLEETHDAVAKGLKFMAPGDQLDFRPGGPKEEKLVDEQKTQIAAEGLEVKTNLEISEGLKFMSLSKGTAVGRLVVIDKGAAMPELGRTDVAVFLGDVPPTAPPVAAIITTQVQTYNSHLGIKYRQDKTPYFYKSFSDDEIAKLKQLSGKPVAVSCTGDDGTITEATQKQADDYVKSVKPTGRVRLTPNLSENKARSFSELAATCVGRNGKWAPKVLAAYGRKTLGVVRLHHLDVTGKLNQNQAPGEPKVVTPKEPMGIPANWYARFMREAKDKDGVVLADRLKTMTTDARFTTDDKWRADQLQSFRKAIEKADMPADLLTDIHDQVAVPYVKTHPGDEAARMRSSSPVVEDSGGNNKSKLPNMAGAFDSHSAHWKTGANADETAKNAAAAMAETLQKDYASVWNDRAISELLWHNVDLDEGSVAMAVLVMPNEENEKANGVIRRNSDLAGFFSVTGETQFGENLVTNPQAGATPDTWIDGNYDVLNGQVNQDIEYERVSNQTSNDPNRPHAYTDLEISAVYKAMQVISNDFAKLEGKDPASYNDECETKVLADGTVQFKQERPWVE